MISLFDHHVLVGGHITAFGSVTYTKMLDEVDVAESTPAACQYWANPLTWIRRPVAVESREGYYPAGEGFVGHAQRGFQERFTLRGGFVASHRSL